MKFLVIVSCLVAATTAGWIGSHGAYHVPVIGPHGVPIDTPEVQHARAAHLAAHAEASAQHGSFGGHQEISSYDDGSSGGGFDSDGSLGSYGGGYEDHSGGYEDHSGGYEDHGGSSYHHSPATSHVSYTSHVSHDMPYHSSNSFEGHESFGDVGHSIQPHAYETHHGLPVVSHDGIPLDTPEVEAAKAHHFAAVHEALSRVSHGAASHYRKRRSIYSYGHEHGASIGHDGHPVETPEVQHAKALHFAAHSKVGFGGGHDGSHYEHHISHVYSPSHGHYDHHEIPAIGHDGKPLDTAEVEHAKAAHFHAYYEAAARNSVAPHHAVGHYGYGGGVLLGHNGAPEDTHEVQIAKAKHFAAHAAANAHHY